MYKNGWNSLLDFRSKPSAMFEVIESEVLSRWVTNEKHLSVMDKDK